ncbi:MAG TPA: hypothetical protein VI564_09425 [Candidatus Nanoarchaeia archaeon]|nr:hypothetical protein [Candidatus Nanoarchaeia archaeon]
MDIIKDISENKFLLVLLPESQYEEKLVEIVKGVSQKHTKVCYVCLSKPYADVLEYLNKLELKAENFFFIDVLTSHYKKPKNADNCIFLQDPNKLIALQAAINKAIVSQNCNAVIFDTFSSLLVYEQSDDIIKFTHQFTMEQKHQDVNKIFIVIKGNSELKEYYDSFVKDISMFAQRTVEVVDK